MSASDMNNFALVSVVNVIRVWVYDLVAFLFMLLVWCLSAFIVQVYVLFFFFKQKTAYEMRISDWSSDVCSSDLAARTVTPSGESRRLMSARTRAVMPTEVAVMIAPMNRAGTRVVIESNDASPNMIVPKKPSTKGVITPPVSSDERREGKE